MPRPGTPEAYGEKNPETLTEIASLSEFAFAMDNLALGNQQLALVQPTLPELAASNNFDQKRAAAHIYIALLARDIFHHIGESLSDARHAKQLFEQLPPEEYSWGMHHQMGVAFFKNFELEEANRQFSDALRLIPVLNGIETSIGSQHTWFAMLKNLTGQYELAEGQYQIGYAQERRSDGSDHGSQTWCLSKYARFLTDIARPKEALLLTRNGGAGSNAALRSQLEHLHKVLFARGMALIHLGPVEQGLAAVERAERIANQLYGDDANTSVADERMDAALELGRIQDEARVLEGTDRALKQLNAEFSLDSRTYWFDRVRLLLAQGNAQEAATVLEQARPILAPRGVGLIELAKLTWLEAGIEQQSARPALARQRLEAMLNRIATSPQRRYLPEWEAHLNEALGVARASLNDATGAETAFKAARGLYGDIFDPATSLSVGRTDLRLAALYRGTGKVAAAKALQLEADHIRQRHPQFEQWLLNS